MVTVDVVCPECKEALTIPMALNLGEATARNSAIEVAVSADITAEGRRIITDHCVGHPQ